MECYKCCISCEKNKRTCEHWNIRSKEVKRTIYENNKKSVNEYEINY